MGSDPPLPILVRRTHTGKALEYKEHSGFVFCAKRSPPSMQAVASRTSVPQQSLDKAACRRLLEGRKDRANPAARAARALPLSREALHVLTASREPSGILDTRSQAIGKPASEIELQPELNLSRVAWAT